MKSMIDSELSEPYSIYTYRYFIKYYADLTYVVYDNDKMVGCIIGKIDYERKGRNRGYVAMLTVLKEYRR